MARILFAVVAALCALAAVSAVPAAFRPESVEAPLPGSDLQSVQLLQRELLHLNPEFRLKFLNSTEILEKIEELLAGVESKIEDVTEGMQSTVTAVMEGIEAAAIGLAGKWNSTLQSWVERANEAGINVQDCLEEQKSLIDLANAFRTEAQQCIAKPIAELSQAVDKVRALGPAIQPIIEELINKIVECNGQQNVVSAGICLLAGVPTVQVKAATLVSKAVVLSGVAATKAAAIGPRATLCTSRATAGKAAEATVIVDGAVQCIKAKLANN